MLSGLITVSYAVSVQVAELLIQLLQVQLPVVLIVSAVVLVHVLWTPGCATATLIVLMAAMKWAVPQVLFLLFS